MRSPESNSSGQPNPSNPDELKTSPETGEAYEDVVDAALEEILEHALVKLNEGSNGVIFRMNVQDITPDHLHALESLGLNFEQERVAKILKVYRIGEGQREYELQQKARELIEAADDPKLASVPRPYLVRDMPITEASRPILESMHPAFKADDRVEVIVMDFFPGEDLSIKLMREVIRRHPNLRHLSEQTDTLDSNEVMREVLNVVGTREEPEDVAQADRGAASHPLARMQKEREAYRRQMHGVYSALDRLGYQLNPEIASALRATMETLHDGGLVHRDIHERNIMIDGSLNQSPGDEIPKIALIDFGTAQTVIGRVTPEAYEVHDETGVLATRFPDDLLMLKPIELLSQSREQRSPEVQRFMMSLESLGKRIATSSDTRWNGLLDRAREQGRHGEIDFSQIYAAPPVGKKLEAFLAVVEILTTEFPALREQAAATLNEMKERASSAAEVNHINWFLKKP